MRIIIIDYGDDKILSPEEKKELRRQKRIQYNKMYYRKVRAGYDAYRAGETK
jgi:hypothetical protein